jgi:hypothetical protein
MDETSGTDVESGNDSGSGSLCCTPAGDKQDIGPRGDVQEESRSDLNLL